MTIPSNDVYHYNGQIAVPTMLVTRDLPLTAIAMYVFICGTKGDLAYDDEAMRSLFFEKYDHSDAWKNDRVVLESVGLLTPPESFEEETEEEAQERISKLLEEIRALD
ncbi:hypothetical protein [Vibrio harveyi]|uniref:hypothetical protein n=1 Tax=Vibrio harveyi group TaxID=717610 RepID=UPI0023803D0A|nr:hypothetical protein [Vibrio harveyi]